MKRRRGAEAWLESWFARPATDRDLNSRRTMRLIRSLALRIRFALARGIRSVPLRPCAATRRRTARNGCRKHPDLFRASRRPADSSGRLPADPGAGQARTSTARTAAVAHVATTAPRYAREPGGRRSAGGAGRLPPGQDDCDGARSRVGRPVARSGSRTHRRGKTRLSQGILHAPVRLRAQDRPVARDESARDLLTQVAEQRYDPKRREVGGDEDLVTDGRGGRRGAPVRPRRFAEPRKKSLAGTAGFAA